MVGGEVFVDQILIVDYVVLYCNSWEYFKIVFDGWVRGVYQGCINVVLYVQKIDGEMMMQVLFLFEEVEMVNKFELEIFVDDVICVYGVISGQIDEDLLFYLCVWGILEVEVKIFLVLVFLFEVIEEYGEDDVIEGLEVCVCEWFVSY